MKDTNETRTNDEPELMTMAEFIAASRLSRTTAYTLAQSGAIQVVRLGKSLRIPRDVLRALPKAGSR
jgi:excisionase family DNA binding protein